MKKPQSEEGEKHTEQRGKKSDKKSGRRSPQFRRFSHSKRILAAVVRSVGLEVADKRDEAAPDNEKSTLEVDGPMGRLRRSVGWTANQK